MGQLRKKTPDLNLEKQACALLSNLRASPRKVNLVLQMIRGLQASQALTALRFSEKSVAQSIYKVLMSAVSNAENNYGYDIDRLYVREAIVGKGLLMKRMSARAKGRGARIKKPFSQVRVIVCEAKDVA